MTTFKEFLTESITLQLVNKLARAFNAPRSAVDAYFVGGDAKGMREFHNAITDDGYKDDATTWKENEAWFKKHGVTEHDYDEVELNAAVDIDLDDEHETIKQILSLMKRGDDHLARVYIDYAKDEGYEYDEFAAIEKSLDAHKVKEEVKVLQFTGKSRANKGDIVQFHSTAHDRVVQGPVSKADEHQVTVDVDEPDVRGQRTKNVTAHQSQVKVLKRAPVEKRAVGFTPR